MPKQKGKLSPGEQSERFKREAQKLIDAGEGNPIEADEAFNGLVRKAAATSK